MIPSLPWIVPLENPGIVRSTMKKIADGQPYNVPATIDDPATLGEIAAELTTIGSPGRKGG